MHYTRRKDMPMDLYHTNLSDYQTNKSQSTRGGNQPNRLPDGSISRNTTSSPQQGEPMELREGQTIKGQVIDHRYNEVTLRLEPGKQTLTARLSSDIPISIGQEAQFTVTGKTPGGYVLKYLPENPSLQYDTTIGKALSASGLPITDRNKAIVAELLAGRLPIDKQTLQTLLRVALTNPEASPQTLVLMYKHNIPLTPANIKQFEAYQKGTHQLVNDLRTISQNISGLLRHSPSTALPSDHAVANALQTNQALLDLLLPSTAALGTAKTPLLLNSGFNQGQLDQLAQILEQQGKDNPSLFTGLIAGTAAEGASEIVPTITSTSLLDPAGNSIITSAFAEIIDKVKSGTLSMNEAADLFTKIMEAGQGQGQPPAAPGGAVQNPLTAADLSLITKLMDQYETSQDFSLPLSKILSPQERLTLTDLLSGLPDAKELKNQLTQGTTTLKELFTLLQEQLPKSDKPVAAKLLQSPEYAKLFEAAFLEKWTLLPRKAADKSAVTNLLKGLREDLDQLQALVKEQSGSSDGEHLQKPVQNLRENLQFAKELNEVFTYLPLPIQFKNQNAHADLYVMTKKKALGDKRENLSVLLHLEMANLGSLNIYLKLNPSNQIQADFYVEEQETRLLIKDHLGDLTTALEEKGYLFQAGVKETYNKPDFSKDFIEQSAQENHMTRYTFDIRT